MSIYLMYSIEIFHISEHRYAIHIRIETWVGLEQQTLFVTTTSQAVGGQNRISLTVALYFQFITQSGISKTKSVFITIRVKRGKLHLRNEDNFGASTNITSFFSLIILFNSIVIIQSYF